MAISPKRRAEILEALRKGTVPQDGLDMLAVGLGPFEKTVDEDLREQKKANNASQRDS